MWLRSSKFCPNCRQRTKAKDIVALFNLPTLVAVPAPGSGAAPVAAAAAGATPSELAQKELLLQKVQRAYSQKEKEAQRQAEEAQRQSREKRRLEQEASAKEQECKRLRQQLEEAHRLLAAAAAAGPAGAATAAASGWNNPNPTSHLGATAATYKRTVLYHNGAVGAGPVESGPLGTSALPAYAQPHHFAPPGQLPLVLPGYSAGAHLHQHVTQPQLADGAAGTQHRGGPSGVVVPGTAHTGAAFAPGGGQPAAGLPTGQQLPPAAAAAPMWGNFTNMQPLPAAPNRGGSSFQPHHHLLHDQSLVHSNGRGAHAANALQARGFNAAAAAGDGSGGGGGTFSRMFDLPVKDSRLMALDVAGGRLLVSEVAGGGGSASPCVRKTSLLAPESSTLIRLPPNAGIVYDMQLPPAAAAGDGGGASPHFLAVATHGAGLCLACPRTDGIVAKFTGLPYRVWSCSWVPQSGGGGGGGNLVLAGLEKGHLALLDIRRTDRPVALLAALQNSGCEQMPVRTVAVLPTHEPTHGSGAAAGSIGDAGGMLWPACALSCPKGAWLLLGGGGSAQAGAPVPALVRLDGGFGGGGAMQLESLSVLRDMHWRTWADGGGGQQPCWRAALSWRPTGAGGGAMGAAPSGPRHEVGWLRACDRTPYKHEATVSNYSRTGHQAVRSCLLADGGGDGTGLLLVSSDEESKRPLVWSLGASAGGGGPQLVQSLDPHAELPTCMVAAGGGGGGGGSYLACGSSSRVAMYRRQRDG